MASEPKRVYVQEWEESEAGWGVRPDGFTLHKDEASHKRFVKAFWDKQKALDGGRVPHEYTRESGEPVWCVVIEPLYAKALSGDGSWVNRGSIRKAKDGRLFFEESPREPR